jgi:Amt family ammonium transporter
VIICAAMVFIMTPGLAFFYGGMVRRKNVLNTMFMSFMVCGVAGLLWVVFGYSVAFGGDGTNPIIGGFDNLFLSGITTDTVREDTTIPELAFVAFQGAFALITIAILTGSVAERMKFSRIIIFVVCWMALVYAPLAHMVWGGGIISQLGALDFAGGDVVHISSGVTGLVLCLLVGKRRGHGFLSYRPHNIPFILLGTALLWFGWFGFNAGSALGANGLAAHAFMTTAAASATGICAWMVADRIVTGKPTLMGACTGCLAGLVVVTPGAGYISIWSAIVEGIIVVPICYFAITKLKKHFGYDDALDAFGCHGIGGIVGGICTGLFTTPELAAEEGMYGLIYGSGKLLIAQLEGIGITLVLVVVMTLVIGGVMKLVGGDLRVDKHEEANGLDRSEHNESAYPAFLGMD